MNVYVLVRPVITEKSMQLAQTRNSFTFEVSRNSSKEQVKQAVEELYKVNVTSVNTIMGHNELKPTGKKRLKSMNARVKKAIVTLKAGQNIALFDLGEAEKA
ncbi:MAG: 50S ribosomal protein L23 [bacterium]|nr:50S ribosomal protein L23 [bacterium]